MSNLSNVILLLSPYLMKLSSPWNIQTLWLTVMHDLQQTTVKAGKTYVVKIQFISVWLFWPENDWHSRHFRNITHLYKKKENPKQWPWKSWVSMLTFNLSSFITRSSPHFKMWHFVEIFKSGPERTSHCQPVLRIWKMKPVA